MSAKLVIFIACCLMTRFSNAQSDEMQLIKSCETAATDAAKVNALGSLAEYYYIFKQEKKADSVLQKQLLTAELSQDKELVLSTLFNNAILYVGSFSSIETFDRTTKFIEKGLSYAKESGRDDYAALAYIRLAIILRRRGQLDEAFQQANLALSVLANSSSDSIRAVVFSEMGDIYLGKGDIVPAYRYYNNAFDIAYRIKNIQLQSDIYHRYASLYQTLGNIDLAQSTLQKSLSLNISNHYTEGLLSDYIDLARITDQKEYIEKASRLADSIHSMKYMMYSKRLMFTLYMVKLADGKTALTYLYNNKDLLQSLQNSGRTNFYWTLGNVYFYAHQPDSAILRYKMAETELEQFDNNSRLLIYSSLAETYAMLRDTVNAISYYEKALAEAKTLHTVNSLPGLTQALSGLYAGSANFNKAYAYAIETTRYKDTLQQLAAQRDVALLEVERENKKHEKDQQELEEKMLRRTNLQYMAITIVLAFLFFMMLIVGMFPVSKGSIRMMGYFSFICLFEFVILLVDGLIHRITHGEPLEVWLIKIGVIVLLVPIQHFLEHGLIKFLASRKLVEARNKFSIKKIWLNIKKPTPKSEAGIEEDTAVL